MINLRTCGLLCPRHLLEVERLPDDSHRLPAVFLALLRLVAQVSPVVPERFLPAHSAVPQDFRLHFVESGELPGLEEMYLHMAPNR